MPLKINGDNYSGVALYDPTTGLAYAAQAAAATYAVLNGATSQGAISPAPGSYALNLPPAFNGATISILSTASNGTTSTVSYTSAPAIPPRFDVFAGTTVTVTATGGTPTGNTTLSGGPSNGSSSTAQLVVQQRQDAVAWTDGSVSQDMRAFRDVEIQVANLSGGDTIVFTRSLENTVFVTPSWIDQSFATGTVVSANGTYNFDGFAFLKWTKTGSASTPGVWIRGSN